MSSNNLSLDENETIFIPLELPHILKEFTKAALRYQPENLYVWAANYFQLRSKSFLNDACLAKIPQDFNIDDHHIESASDNLNTNGMNGFAVVPLALHWTALQQLHNQCYNPSDGTVAYSKLKTFWLKIGLWLPQLHELLALGQWFSGRIPWLHFSSLCCSTLANDIRSTLVYVCRLWAGLTLMQLNDVVKFLSEIEGKNRNDSILKWNEYLLNQVKNDDDRLTEQQLLNAECPNV